VTGLFWWDWIGLGLLIITISLYFIYHVRFHPITEHLNELIALILCIWTILNIFMIFYTARVRNDPLANLLGWLTYIAPVGMWIFILFCTGISKLFKWLPKLNQSRDAYLRRRLNTSELEPPIKKIRRDRLRKFMHILFFFVILGLQFITAELFEINGLMEELDQQRFWGIQADLFYFDLLRDYANPMLYLQFSIAQCVNIYVFFIGMIVAMFLDWIRLSTRFWMIGRNSLLLYARKSEINSIPTFLLMFIGLLPVSLILPPLPIFAILFLLIVADTAASQIGIRWGQHKFPWNPQKSWEGAIAGCLTGFGSAIFVGPIWGGIAMLGFFLSDALTDRPLKLADNLVTPLITGLLFIFLMEIGFVYSIPWWI
jgi:dolichol kinase